MDTYILTLFNKKIVLASGVWGLFGDRLLGIDLPFVSPSFPHQVVCGAWCIEGVTEGIWGSMGPFVVHTKVTHGLLFTYYPNPPPYSELLLELWISNYWFQFFSPVPSP